MKKTYLILFVLAISKLIIAQQPQKVYSIIKDRHEIGWYVEQQTLWKKEIDKNEKNANAWYNYYAATRALRNLHWGNDEEVSKYRDQCNEIAEEVLEKIPNTFESNHLQWWNGNKTKEDFNYLKKAYEIDPNNSDTYTDFMIQYELEQDYDQFETFGVKSFKSNVLAAPLLNWSYNILVELDPDAVLFTAGDNDTFGPWVVQTAKNIRTDVQIINTSLLQMDDYRGLLFEKLGLEPLNIKLEESKTNEEYATNLEKIYNHLVASGRPIYVSGTAVSQFEEWTENLHLTGLAYLYSKERIDNISIIKRNYEKRYLLDHLKEVFSYNIGNQIEERLYGFYLPSMVKLYKHYLKSEFIDKQTDLLKTIIRISEMTGQQTEISELLEQEKEYNPVVYRTMLFNAKKLVKNFEKIDDRIYFAKTEVTNLDYRSFLDNLKRSDQQELYHQSRYDSSAWQTKFNFGFVSPMVENYHWHPAYDMYPVVNITYENAQEYCKWLTIQYNSQRKRNFTQVLFRLPTLEEWRNAAGFTPKSLSCFEGDKIQNDEQCYLANLKVDKQDFYSDGGFFMVKVDSYVMNKNGLYNVLGNVAEMTDKKGQAVGGSWYHLYEESTFNKTQNYNGPDPGVGFRLVMEVIQE